MKKHLLPHFSIRKTPVYMLVLHSSAHNTENMIRILDNHKLSAHYTIGYDGIITKLVDEENCAWHAGKSFWRGHENLNTYSIGIEISNQTLGQTPYNEKQINSLMKLLSKIIKEYGIKNYNIVGHSDIAPTRKPDPGKSFPWKKLADSGIGLWYDINDAEKMTENDVIKLLNIIGYDTRDEESIIASCYAFRRRFLPEEVFFDDDIYHLVNNVYPVGDKSLLLGEAFIKTLKAVAYKYFANSYKN